eukprot:6457608-Amphidinium_carterae.1
MCNPGTQLMNRTAVNGNLALPILESVRLHLYGDWPLYEDWFEIDIIVATLVDKLDQRKTGEDFKSFPCRTIHKQSHSKIEASWRLFQTLRKSGMSVHLEPLCVRVCKSPQSVGLLVHVFARKTPRVLQALFGFIRSWIGVCVQLAQESATTVTESKRECFLITLCYDSEYEDRR